MSSTLMRNVRAFIKILVLYNAFFFIFLIQINKQASKSVSTPTALQFEIRLFITGVWGDSLQYQQTTVADLIRSHVLSKLFY